MALTGFNPEQVKRSIKSVVDAYSDLYDAIVSVTQTAFVNPMANLWCCKEAVDFFNKTFKPAIDNLQDGAQKTFESVVNAMNSAAESWARRTGNTGAFSKIAFNPRTKRIDVSGIKDKNAKGDIGIDEVGAVAKGLLLVTKTYVKAAAALAKAVVAVAVCGFLGGSQASSLKSSLSNIRKSMDETTQALAKGVSDAVKNSVDAYKDVGSRITSAFNGD